MVEACNDPEIARWTTVPSPYGKEDAKAFAGSAAAGLAAGTELVALIADADDGSPLGAVGLHAINPQSGRCSAGYWIAREARGRSLAPRALALLCRYGFDELHLRRIELWIEPENGASLRVAEACGFTREGLLRSFSIVNGQHRDMLMYSLLDSDPRPQPPIR